MAMPKRGPLEQIRKDVTKHAKDITALKARIVDAESRLAKAETALGTVAKSGVDAGNFAPQRDTERDVTLSDPEQQPETE